MRALPFSLMLSGLLLTVSTSAQAQERRACDSDKLIKLLSDGTHDVLGTLLEAGQQWDASPGSPSAAAWPGLRDEALAEFEKELAGCDPAKELTPPIGTAFHAIYEKYRPTLKSTLERYVEASQLSSPVFSQVLGAVGGIPVPQRLQVGLSQVVSAGQPGLAVNVAGAISPNSDTFCWRHTSVTGTLLVIQPVSPPSTDGTPSAGLQQPQFATLESMLAFSSVRTAYDWSIEVTRKQAEILKQSEQTGLFATQQFLRHFQSNLDLRQPAENQKRQAEDAQLAAAPAAEKPKMQQDIQRARALREEQLLRVALEESSEAARRFYQDVMGDYFTRTFIEPEQKRVKHPFHLDGALRVRATPRPDFVPELPDMLSLGLDVTGDGAWLGDHNSSQVLYNFRLMASGSAYPTRECSRFSNCDAQASLLIDAAAGFGLTLPSQDLPADTIFRASGLLRWAPFRNAIIDGQEVEELSGGFTTSLEVPVAPTVSLLGTYTMRWVKGSGPVATSGITIAKTLPK